MGVRRLSSRGGQKFSRGGGQEPTFCLNNNKKIVIFPIKSTNILFLWGGGGARAPLPSPADAHVNELFLFFVYLLGTSWFPSQIKITISGNVYLSSHKWWTSIGPQAAVGNPCDSFLRRLKT